jgi:hypothetical protein
LTADCADGADGPKSFCLYLQDPLHPRSKTFGSGIGCGGTALKPSMVFR